MAQLYCRCFNEDNIIRAINNTNLSRDNKTIKNIKLILRRCKPQHTNINDYQKLLKAANLAVYYVISPIINKNISKNSYALRENVNKKIPIAKICSKMFNSKNTYTICLDFKDFNINHLDQSLDSLRRLGITDGKLLSTIKSFILIQEKFHFERMLLFDVLENCYLSYIDMLIEAMTDPPSKNFSTDFERHKDDYIPWLYNMGRKPACKYYRYQNHVALLINTRVEFDEIKLRFITMMGLYDKKDINIKYNYNRLNFLGFKIIKRKEYNSKKIGITPSNEKEVIKILRNTKWNTQKDISESMNIVLNFLNEYDICNNLYPFLNRLLLRIIKIARRKNSVLKKIPNTSKYQYQHNGITTVIDIYDLRKKMRVSYKQYSMNKDNWLIKKDNINAVTQFMNTYQLYRYALWNKQKGRDIITGNQLNPKYMHIHHVDGNHFNNAFNNLILISKNTHKLIHSKIDINDIMKDPSSFINMGNKKILLKFRRKLMLSN